MNVDGDSNINIIKVRSKYFTTEHMDDSLTDFQETKKINTGPKIPKAITKKPRKTYKRIKGQRDIRSALEAKKDELVTYTKQFDVICRKSGIDVDPEQLELAITLSKSLQSEPLNGDYTSNIDLSTQEKTKRIRNTLQEYGFKVPETKITTKKLKKNHNNYKLFSCTNANRLQVISDRFAQVLLKNINNFKTNTITDFSKTPLYYISTSISYEEIKNDEVFYVDGLIDRSKQIGSLLRNWAEIPGRPLSPVNIDCFEMNFSEIECSQDELDLALSGSLKAIKNIIKSKQIGNTDRNVYTPDTNNKFNNISQHNCLEIQNKVKNDVGSQLLQHEYRSCSPDIFEDEISTSENVKNNISICEDKLSYVMDLTECVNVNTDLATKIVDKKVDNVNKSNIVLLQSRRKSDDVMEITECVASTSRFNNQYMHNHEIVLTQSYNNPESILNENRSENINIDLTQSSNSSDELPIVHLTDKDSLGDTIIINACDYENIINTRKIGPTTDKQEIFYLTQDCKTTELNEGNSSTKGFFEDYDYRHSDHSEEYFENKDKCTDKRKIDEKVDLTKITDSLNELSYKRVHDVLYKKISSSSDGNENKNNVRINTELNKSTDCIINIPCKITEEITSLDKIKECKQLVDMAEDSDSRQVIIVENEQFNSRKIQSSYSNFHNNTEDEIDLTQHSFHTNGAVNNSSQKIRTSSLGRKDSVSIDYDEISNESKYNSPINGEISSKSAIYEIADEFNTVDKVTNHSQSDDAYRLSQQNSEVFEIIDNELNYSLLQSRHENFNTSNLFAINHSSVSQKFSEVINLDDKDTIAGHSNDLDNLPEIDLKGTQEDPIITRIDNENVNLLETTKSNDFIIKTGEVTPMKDFASMSTPERNQELDKYGIKPFKRKRAIQLLTYIYNQTHPTIDENFDCIQSPPKKLKQNASPRKSPKKLTSPKIICTQYLENIENVYEVTNEVPVIRELECSVEDWVFQKREKAKVHSCRVPLHVAFHNYVSCRRGLREAILRYEPVNIDIIHKQLVGYGHRYDPKDLLKFMDKKCITVKTTDNNGRNNRN